MKNFHIKKTIPILLIVINSIILTGCLVYFVYGSLEQFPTADQNEKVRIVLGVLALLSLISETFLVIRIIKK